MAKYVWNQGAVPKNLEVKQVYGIAFNEEGKIALLIDNGKYKLIGGKPESKETYEETLKREFLEEVNITLEECFYLGYFLVEEDDKKKIAQVRMIAKIKKIGPPVIDIATGKKFERFLVCPNQANDYLKYKDKAGKEMLKCAYDLAKEKYSFI